MTRRQVIVTAGDIAKGEPMATSPLFSAIERLVKPGTWFWIRHDCVVFRVGAGRERRAEFGAATRNWCAVFDHKGIGKPFSFHLDVPAELLTGSSNSHRFRATQDLPAEGVMFSTPLGAQNLSPLHRSLPASHHG